MPNTLTNRFKNLCRSMEEPATKAANEGRRLRPEEHWSYRLHDLRHYTATELFRQGHHARTVADRLGHSDPALTLRVYTHDTDDLAIAAAPPSRPVSPSERSRGVRPGYPRSTARRGQREDSIAQSG